MAKEESESQRKSREKLVKTINSIQKRAYTQILDQVETVVIALARDPESFKPLRTKILRASNEAIRQLEKELERSYIIEYECISEDMFIFKQN